MRRGASQSASPVSANIRGSLAQPMGVVVSMILWGFGGFFELVTGGRRLAWESASPHLWHFAHPRAHHAPEAQKKNSYPTH